ncbi:MAG: NFACT family protein [Candidatus Micrarchaeia archaeon]
MQIMENMEYCYVIGEIEKLLGLRFEKIQTTREGEFSLKIGKERITIDLGKRMNISYTIKEGELGKGFIEKIRKELRGTRFVSIYQHNMDRIIVLEFEGIKKYFLILEMFGKGNMILVCDEKILACYKNESWADRKIRINERYIFPKSNIAENLNEIISEKYIISSMMRLPLGKKYSREILLRCKIDEKAPGNSLANGQMEKIEKEIEKIKSGLKPYGFYRNGKICGFGLAKLGEFKDLEAKEFEAFSKVIDEYYINFVETETESEATKKIKKRLVEQKKQLNEFLEDEKKYREIGDKIYENYPKIEELIKKERGKPKIEIEL